MAGSNLMRLRAFAGTNRENPCLDESIEDSSSTFGSVTILKDWSLTGSVLSGVCKLKSYRPNVHWFRIDSPKYVSRSIFSCLHSIAALLYFYYYRSRQHSLGKLTLLPLSSYSLSNSSSAKLRLLNCFTGSITSSTHDAADESEIRMSHKTRLELSI